MIFKKYTNDKKEVERRSKKYNCNGLCYSEKGMCPCAEYCDETRYKEFIATIFAHAVILLIQFSIIGLSIYFCLK